MKATLAALGKPSDMPPELMGFVNFKAGVEKRQLDGKVTLAVLRIGSTESYHVVFLDPGTTVKDIDVDLARIEAKLDEHARVEIENALKARRKK